MPRSWSAYVLVSALTAVAGLGACSSVQVSLTPERVRASESATAELTLRCSGATPHLVAGQSGVRLRASTRVLIGDTVAEILRVDAHSLTVRAGVALAVGSYDVALEVAGTRYWADRALAIYDLSSDAGVDQAILDSGADAGVVDGGAHDSSIEQSVDQGEDTGQDSGGLLATPCDTTDTTLVACYQFERDVQDGSSYARSASSNLDAYVRSHDGLAAVFVLESSFQIVETTGIAGNLAHTVAAWVQPSVNADAAVVDYGGGFALRFQSNPGAPAAVLCEAPDAVAVGSAVAAPVEPYHVACVFDEASVAVYVGGVLQASSPRESMPFSSTPIHIGEASPLGDQQFRGKIDDVRMWSRAMTDAEVCAASGNPACD